MKIGYGHIHSHDSGICSIPVSTSSIAMQAHTGCTRGTTVCVHLSSPLIYGNHEIFTNQIEWNNWRVKKNDLAPYIGAWVWNYMRGFLWFVISHPWPNINGDLTKAPLNLWHGWVSTSAVFMWMYLPSKVHFIHMKTRQHKQSFICLDAFHPYKHFAGWFDGGSAVCSLKYGHCLLSIIS